MNCYSPKSGAKIKYPDEESAIAAAKGAGKRLNGKINAYQCGWCGFWHIGHG